MSRFIQDYKSINKDYDFTEWVSTFFDKAHESGITDNSHSMSNFAAVVESVARDLEARAAIIRALSMQLRFKAIEMRDEERRQAERVAEDVTDDLSP